MAITKPGIYPDILADEYFANPCPALALTSSGIKTLLSETPKDFKEGDDKVANAAMRRGDVVHQLALGKGKGYIVSPYDEYRTNEAKAWRDLQLNIGLTPVKEKEFAPIQDMAAIVKDRISRATKGKDYQTEVVFAWIEETQYGPIWCRAMADVWCEGELLMLDPKITANLAADKIQRHISSMNWHVQNCLYVRGMSKISPDYAGRIRFRNLLINPKPPHTFRSIGISEAYRSIAEMKIERAIDLFAKCLYSDNWPGYPENDEIIDPPAWELNQALQAELEEEESE